MAEPRDHSHGGATPAAHSELVAGDFASARPHTGGDVIHPVHRFYMVVRVYWPDGTEHTVDTADAGPVASPLPHGLSPQEAADNLWTRRAGYNPVRVPGGLAFDTYPPGSAPSPDLQGCRTRVTYLYVADPAQLRYLPRTDEEVVIQRITVQPDELRRTLFVLWWLGTAPRESDIGEAYGLRAQVLFADLAERIERTREQGHRIRFADEFEGAGRTGDDLTLDRTQPTPRSDGPSGAVWPATSAATSTPTSTPRPAPVSLVKCDGAPVCSTQDLCHRCRRWLSARISARLRHRMAPRDRVPFRHHVELNPGPGAPLIAVPNTPKVFRY